MNYSAGDLLGEILRARGVTQAQVAARMGRPAQVISEIVTGKKSITFATATELEAALKVPAEVWLAAQTAHGLREQRIESSRPVSDKTQISWTDATWNPATGCTRVSDGCTNCYIERTPPFRMAHRRFDGTGAGSTTGVLLHPERLRIPMHWRKPRKVFVCSLADLFHRDVPADFIAAVFAAMAVCPAHTFQVLTKRPDRMRSVLGGDFRDQVAEETTELLAWTPSTQARHWPLKFDRATKIGNVWGPSVWPLPNVWVGTTVESAKYLWRIDLLRKTPATVRFLSLEPLLGPLPNLDLTGIDWVIVGGESGPGARPMHPDWARDIRDQCQAAGVPFHFKQHGEWISSQAGLNEVVANGRRLRYPRRYLRLDGSAAQPFEKCALVDRVGKRLAGRELDGRTWDEYPKVLV